MVYNIIVAFGVVVGTSTKFFNFMRCSGDRFEFRVIFSGGNE